MTFDTEGEFRNKKISCVLLLKGIVPLAHSHSPSNVELILQDIKGQV